MSRASDEQKHTRNLLYCTASNVKPANGQQSRRSSSIAECAPPSCLVFLARCCLRPRQLPSRRLPNQIGSAQWRSHLIITRAPSSAIDSAGSFQNDGFLGGGYDVGFVNESEYGFSHPDFGQGPLVGTVELYERHVFLCYKNPQVWPPRIEAAEFDRLPRLLAAALVRGRLK